ncbi:MAG: hypothetical protein AAF447_00420 [Myxococcota bacterium]
MDSGTQELFVGCAAGLERVLAEELRELALPGTTAELTSGGARLETPPGLATLARLNLELGVAEQVRLRLGRFACPDLATLAREAAALPWAEVLTPASPLRLRAFSTGSRLSAARAMEAQVHAALVEALGDSPPRASAGDAGAVAVSVRVVDDEALVSVDTSGAPLHARGYRGDFRGTAAMAPLRPDLARALLRVSGWDREATLVDPFVGQGTILIEAALLARKRAPGLGRRFAFESFPGGAAARDAAERDARARERSPVALSLRGSDIDAQACAAAAAAAERAGVRADLTLEHADFDHAPALEGVLPERGALITDAPRAAFFQGRSQRRLYARFGERARALPPGWTVALASQDPRFARRTNLPLRVRLRSRDGAATVALMTPKDAG